MELSELFEGTHGSLYHVMDEEKAWFVFANNIMPARWEHRVGNREIKGNSFSRNSKFWFNQFKKVKITVDRKALLARNKVIPLDAEFVYSKKYYGDDITAWTNPPRDREMNNRGTSFQEEFVIGDIRDLHKIIERIDIRDIRSQELVELITQYCTKYSIPLYNQTELVESRLVLRGGEINRARGSYGAFIITLHPLDFLKLTTHDQREMKVIQDKPFPYKADDLYDPAMDGKFELPFLMVEFPSGQILGHEGRHRASMILKQGGDKFPVMIYPRSDDRYTGVIAYWDDSGHRREYHTPDEFTTKELAIAAAKKAVSDIPEDDIIKVKTIFTGHRTLKGEPNRSEGWEHAAWVKEDFPHQLRGQFNHNVVVTDFQVGLVKGYRHFRR
jgi:hypothetical protein